MTVSNTNRATNTMRKSVSTPTFVFGATLPVIVQASRRTSGRAPSAFLEAAATIAMPAPEEVAEAVALTRTTLSQLGQCTQAYGFPDEVLRKSNVAQAVKQHAACLMQPDEGTEDERSRELMSVVRETAWRAWTQETYRERLERWMLRRVVKRRWTLN